MKLTMADIIKLRCLINGRSLRSSRFQPFVADWPIWLHRRRHLFRARLAQAMNLHATGRAQTASLIGGGLKPQLPTQAYEARIELLSAVHVSPPVVTTKLLNPSRSPRGAGFLPAGEAVYSLWVSRA